MALVHIDDRRLHIKIVYYGPGLGGKTTNLRCLYRRLPGRLRGEWIALKTGEDRTLYFDFLPLHLSGDAELATRLHLYTVPGQPRFRRSRLVMLRDVDGVVFVADSRPLRRYANRESLDDLRRNLEELGRDADALPVVFQWNKRDLSPCLPEETLRAELGAGGRPCHPAVAVAGLGVVDTLKSITKLVLRDLAAPAAGAAR
ncbi:MAG: gliding-motility protein MglA [Candidatus Eisenbacteria bacterium]|nr:gliding-motility protein MglA [Candidatus Eisenbacteria bacterium]